MSIFITRDDPTFSSLFFIFFITSPSHVAHNIHNLVHVLGFINMLKSDDRSDEI